MDLRIDTRSYLATLLVGLGLTPLSACERSATAESEAESEAESDEPRSNARPSTRTKKPRHQREKRRNGGKFPCDQSFAVKVGGKPTGLELCAGGYHHRVGPQQCASELPREGSCSATGGGHCDRDADCTDGAYGFCRDSSDQGWSPHARKPAGYHPTFCGCDYGCATDADCSGGQICLCDTPVGRCVQSNCKSDAECDDGMLCAELEAHYGRVSFACQKVGDECMKHSDCSSGKRCRLAGNTRRCQAPEPIAVPGRPFLVRGRPRTATTTVGDAWSMVAPPRPQLAPLSSEERERLADHWARAGLMEHASVAAFARFALQLLSQAAPPHLVAAAHHAAADEVRHARQCFALASAYAGRPIGPGSLEVSDALTEATPAEVLRMVFREGCIGETVAALEAAEAERAAEDGAVRDVLRQIAVDELRHAELAWRYVGWALEGDHDLEPVVFEEVQRAQRLGDREGGDREDGVEDGAPFLAQALRRHGVLGAAHSREVRRRAIDDVVVPCLAALRRSAA